LTCNPLLKSLRHQRVSLLYLLHLLLRQSEVVLALTRRLRPNHTFPRGSELSMLMNLLVSWRALATLCSCVVSLHVLTIKASCSGMVNVSLAVIFKGRVPKVSHKGTVWKPSRCFIHVLDSLLSPL